MRRLGSSIVVVALLASPATARAQEDDPAPVDADTRLRARQLGADALALYAQKDWAGALAKFDQAHALIPAPTLAVRSARCLVELGRLVEASERYVEITRTPLPATAPFVHRRAQQEARLELAALLPRIPAVVVRVNVVVDHVTVDAVELPPALLGERRPLDPGEHNIVVIRGGERLERQLTLAEGEIEEVEIELDEASTGPVGATPPPPPSEAVDPWQVARWVAVGVAGAGIAAGVSHSFVALAQQDSLSDQCPNDACPPEAWDQADFYDTVRIASTIGFIAAGVGIAGGVGAYFLAPPEASTSATGWTISPTLGAGRVGISGRF